MLKKRLLPLLGALSIALLVGCTAGDERRANEAAEETREAADAVGDNMEETREQWVASMDRRMEQYETRMGELKERAQRATGNTKREVDQEINDLDRKMEGARTELGKVREAGEDAWRGMKSGVSTAVDEIGDGMESAWNRVKD